MSNSVSSSQLLPSQKKSLAVAISALVGSGHTAMAQNVLEEVIVTATKREASLQDVPVSITAFSTSDIARRGFEGVDDYAKYIPGLAVGRREPGGSSVVFRGVAASGIQFGTNPSSGVYLDEQPITAAGLNPDPRLVDIERVEALSGPQGTLFGDASQSGTLRIITNKPDASAFDSFIEASGSKVDGGDAGYDVSAMLNFPVIENELAIRLVGFHSEEAGYIDNVLGSSQGGTFDNAAFVEDDVNTRDIYGGRAALRWTPNDDLTVDLSAAFQDVEAGGFGDTNRGAGDLSQVRFNDETLEEDWYQVGLTIEGKLGWADALLHTSYFKRDFRYDADGTDYQFAFNQSFDTNYYAVYDFGGDPSGGFAINDIGNKRWTVEARLSTPSDSDSKWFGLVGLFYNRSEEKSVFASGNADFAGSPGFYYIAYNVYFNNLPYLDYYGTIINPDFNAYAASLNGLPPGSWAPTNNWFFGTYDETIKQFAIFGEMSFDFTENFTVTAGGRWFRVERDFNLVLGALQQGNALSPNLDTDFILSNETVDEVESGFVPRVNATYRFADNKMVYFTYSQGFRSGGANPVKRTSGIPRGYESDKLKNFEIGAKSTWLDGKLQLNFTAYRMKWDNIQVQIEDPNPLVFALGIVNFPEAEIDGFEFNFDWLATEGLEINGLVAYNDATISQTATLDFLGFPLTATEGSRLPITPEWKASLSTQYTFQREFMGAQPFVRFDLAYTGESINAISGLEAVVGNVPPTIQDPYTVGDIRVGLDGDKWSASLYLENMWDERASTFVNNRWAKRRFGINQPRTVGVTFRKRFN